MTIFIWSAFTLVYAVIIYQAAKEVKKFLNLKNFSTERFPIIGFKRIIKHKIIPRIVPVIEYNHQHYILYDFNEVRLPELETKIRCFKAKKEIIYFAYQALFIPLILVTFPVIFAGIYLELNNFLLALCCILVIIIIIALTFIDRWQIYGLNFWSKVLPPDIWGRSKKITDTDYQNIIKENRILNYEEAKMIHAKDQAIHLTLMIPILVFWILGLVFQSLLL